MTFEEWLRTHKPPYRPQTVKQTLATAKLLERQWRAGEASTWNVNYLPHMKRLIRYRESIAKRDDAFTKALRAFASEHKMPGKARKHEARSFRAEDWIKLYAAINMLDTAAGIVLVLIAHTGLRIGDALRVQYADLKHALETNRPLPIERKGGVIVPMDIGGSREQWEALYARMSAQDPIPLTVAAYVAPKSTQSAESGYGPYRQVQNALIATATALGIEGRIHLHRMRRTVAVQALSISKGDVHAVMQLLAHRKPDTTLGYIDELREKEVGDLQRKLAMFRDGKTNP